MQATCQEFLACTAFTEQEYGCITVGDLLDRAANPLHACIAGQQAAQC